MGFAIVSRLQGTIVSSNNADHWLSSWCVCVCVAERLNGFLVLFWEFEDTGMIIVCSLVTVPYFPLQDSWEHLLKGGRARLLVGQSNQLFGQKNKSVSSFLSFFSLTPSHAHASVE